MCDIKHLLVESFDFGITILLNPWGMGLRCNCFFSIYLVKSYVCKIELAL